MVKGWLWSTKIVFYQWDFCISLLYSILPLYLLLPTEKWVPVIPHYFILELVSQSFESRLLWCTKTIALLDCVFFCFFITLRLSNFTLDIHKGKNDGSCFQKKVQLREDFALIICIHNSAQAYLFNFALC